MHDLLTSNRTPVQWCEHNNFFLQHLSKDMSFSTKFTLEQRLHESGRIRTKYPNRIPCIIQRAATSKKTVPDLNKHKFLVPRELQMSAVMQIVRKRMDGRLKPEESLYMFVRHPEGKKTIIVPITSSLSTIDDKYKHSDGFVYIDFAGESTFG